MPFKRAPTILANFNSNWGHTNFLPTIVNGISMVLPYHPSSLPVDTHFLFLPKVYKTLLSQANLLSCLLDFQHFGISCSCAHKRWYLKLSSTDGHQCLQKNVFQKKRSWGTLLISSLSSSIRISACFPHIQGWSSGGSSPPLTENFTFDSLFHSHYGQNAHQSPIHPWDPLYSQVIDLGGHLS